MNFGSQEDLDGDLLFKVRYRHRRKFIAVGIVLALLLVMGGVLGVGRYVETFWLYRGFAAPKSFNSVVVTSRGKTQKVFVVAGEVTTIVVRSPALGNRPDHVEVYLPPGYATDPGRRYPVLYLLHGTPGSPLQFVNVGDVQVVADLLIAEKKMKPMIIVMPSGSFGMFADEEWANTVRPHNDWETFVARDLVATIGHRYRTLSGGQNRGIGGLSEGAYGALNIGFHHVGEFGLIEGWSPYYKADRNPVFFGRSASLLNYNSPSYVAPLVASRLRATHTYIWLYTGTRDYTNRGSKKFAKELSLLHVAYAYSIHHGRHNWLLWRKMMPQALIVASQHLGNHV